MRGHRPPVIARSPARDPRPATYPLRRGAHLFRTVSPPRVRVTASHIGLTALFSSVLVFIGFQFARETTFNHSQFSGTPL